MVLLKSYAFHNIFVHFGNAWKSCQNSIRILNNILNINRSIFHKFMKGNKLFIILFLNLCLMNLIDSVFFLYTLYFICIMYTLTFIPEVHI